MMSEAIRKEHMQMIFHTRQMIQSRETVFLFPEGRLSPDGKAPFQKGIEFFTKEAKAVIFVRIQGFEKRKTEKITLRYEKKNLHC